MIFPVGNVYIYIENSTISFLKQPIKEPICLHLNNFNNKTLKLIKKLSKTLN